MVIRKPIKAMHKLTDEQLTEIIGMVKFREKMLRTYSTKAIAHKFGVSKSLVCKVALYGLDFRDVDYRMKLQAEKRRNAVQTAEVVEEVASVE